MNTNNIKKYAPHARRKFIEAVGKRLNQFGVYNKGKALTISEPSFSGSVMQIDGNSFDAGLAKARKRLVKRAQQLGFELLVERVAYTWFNRLCAIRFIELKSGYLEHGLRVLSPSPLQGEGRGEGRIPEILDHAQDVADQLGLDRNHIVELKLAGNKDEELYRHLLLGQCHKLHEAMPFLFEALDDETELLLPDNLTRTDSILRGLVNSIPEEDWQQVEIIGWLYQFYISEKKDQVIDSVVKSEDIPAATQLFTPNWIVKYLVQNSVGRQWLMTYPDSGLKAQMAYYIEPAEQDASVTADLAATTPASIEPESIKVIDPACGSGHILVEAYDVLKAIYEERGYRSRDIPKLILENNLFGLDIDDRAAQLAGFALMMKAREDDRRIFSRDIKLNVLALQEVKGLGVRDEWQVGNYSLPELFEALSLDGYRRVGDNLDLFAGGIGDEGLGLRDEGCEKLPPNPSTLIPILKLFEHAKTFGSLIQVPADQANFLHNLKNQLQTLTEQGDSFQKPAAAVLLPLVQQAWVLAQRYEAVIANPPYMGGKGMNAELKAFAQKHFPDSKSDLFAMFMERWGGIRGEGLGASEKHQGQMQGHVAMVTMQSWMFLSSYEKFREQLLDKHTFITMAHLGARAFGQISGEVVQTTAFVLAKNHIPYYRPAFFRLIEGNEEVKRLALLNKENAYNQTEQDDFKKIPGSPIAYWLSKTIVESYVSGNLLGDYLPIRGGMTTADNDRFNIVPTLQRGNAAVDAPASRNAGALQDEFPRQSVGTINKQEGLTVRLEPVEGWTVKPLMVRQAHHERLNLSVHHEEVCNAYPTLEAAYQQWQTKNRQTITEMQRLEQENNRLFIDAYGLQDELEPDVPLEQITLTVNPYYRYGVKLGIRDEGLGVGTADENSSLTPHPSPLDKRFQSDTLAELISYAIGCMMGRYRIDKPGLIYAHAGNVDFEKIYNGVTSDEWRGASKKLSRSDRVAEIDGVGGANLSHDQDLSERGTLRADQPNSQGSGINPIEYSGRSGSEIHSRVSELSVHSAGIESGSRNPDINSTAFGLCNTETNSRNTSLAGRNFENAQYASEQINSLSGEWRERVTHHSSLSARHFQADDDGIIPLTDQPWFKDDATNRFRDFARTVWGEAYLQENLDFVAESLCLSALKPKKSESSLETIRRYLSTQFYKDHLKTYKKRPIYWLFSSGKHKAFECLVYLHRYNESTLSRMRTGYVTPLLGKYDSFSDQLNKQIEDSTTSEAILLKKELAALEKKQTELRAFDDKLKHYADRRIKLDLDEGVKVNYGKFGDLLAEVKAVTGGTGD